MNQTLSRSLESGPAEELDLDDICSDLSSSPPTPRNDIKHSESGFSDPLQSASTSAKDESGVRPLKRLTLSELPTGAFQGANDDTSGSQVFLGALLVRDVAFPAPNGPAFSPSLDRQTRTRRHILL